MNTLNSKSKVVAGFLVFAGLATTAIAWQDTTHLKSPVQQTFIDTIPERNIHIELDMKDLDKSMKDLDVQLEKAGKELKDFDWSKISNEINTSLKNIDFQKIQLDVEKSLKDVNWEKISQDVKESLSKVDMDKIRLQVDKAMQEAKTAFNSEEFKKNMETLKTVDMEKLRKEMEKVKVDLQINKEKMKVDIEGQLSKAKEQISQAKEELTQTREMIDLMEKDGLINMAEGFSIELKDKTLYINDKPQSEQVAAKYRKYFSGKDFSIKMKK